jgi:cardiolipin synthase
MNDEVKKNLLKNAKRDAFTIPNILTYIRILLVPVFIVLYLKGYPFWSFLTLAVSAATDVADGYIARHYNMISDLGKFMDPLADKLTQAAMILCVALRFPLMWVLLGIHIIKELAILRIHKNLVNETGVVTGSKWYGKCCTVLLYAVLMLHVLWPEIPIVLSNVLCGICMAMILFCFVMYARLYKGEIRRAKERKASAVTGEAADGQNKAGE